MSGDAPPSSDATLDASLDAPRVPVLERQLDLLFVIESSPAMLDKQALLDANYVYFANVLSTIQGGLPNLHLAVVTTDLGTKGAADLAPGPAIGSGAGACANEGDAAEFRTTAMLDGAYLIDVANTDGNRTRNYTGSFTDRVRALANVGAEGCEFPQPLEAAKRALESSAPTHQGFLRPDAYLAIVFVGASDDCSLAHSALLGDGTSNLGPLTPFRCNRFGHTCEVGGQDSNQMNQIGTKSLCASNESSAYLTRVADYSATFRALKSDPSKVILATVTAPTTPYEVVLSTPAGGGSPFPAVAESCSFNDTSGIVSGDPAVRFADLGDAFPNRFTFTTICQANFSDALTLIAQLLAAP